LAGVAALLWGRRADRTSQVPGQRLASADGTSPKVADVDRYTLFEPVYDLTIDGIHTYYVTAGGTDLLVHNCEKRADS
jgi:hypothetical protein